MTEQERDELKEKKLKDDLNQLRLHSMYGMNPVPKSMVPQFTPTQVLRRELSNHKRITIPIIEKLEEIINIMSFHVKTNNVSDDEIWSIWYTSIKILNPTELENVTDWVDSYPGYIKKSMISDMRTNGFHFIVHELDKSVETRIDELEKEFPWIEENRKSYLQSILNSKAGFKSSEEQDIKLLKEISDFEAKPED